MKVLAVAETRDGGLRASSLEAMTVARTIADAGGGEADALLAGGAGVAEHAADLARYGADTIFVAEHESLATLPVERLASLARVVIAENAHDVVVLSATAFGSDLAPRIAAKLEIPLAGDATAVEIADGELRITRPVYGGRAFATIAIDLSPRIISLRPNVFGPQERPAAGRVERVVDLPQAGPHAKLLEVRASTSTALDVSEAAVVVSGGRGMRGPENWHLLEELCAAIGPHCSLGASRAVVDAGWRPHSEQVGQTGRTVAPRLYIAVGISGAMQHLAGMRTSATIVAINKDPDAPIFRVADYGIVGDAFEIVPRLTEEIRRLRAAG
ncbi:MAG TPA: electron transfer flavoprotein subunit alpha/FixB family protein [Longimicrobiales bacterium]|nr:electron transfer flavoprotein subunit alpha/FixB family protein [Longimicrobiales bacterium]